MRITCNTCHAPKEPSEFYKDKTKINGRNSHCKSCTRKKAAAQYREITGTKAEYQQGENGYAKSKYDEIACGTCHKQFKPTSVEAKYCSRSCSAQSPRTKRSNPKGRQSQMSVCVQCQSMFIQLHPSTHTCSTQCSDDLKTNRYRNKTHLRRTRIHSTEYERINTHEIFQRDSWTCGICNQPIDSALRYPDPQSGSLDHIKPISRGGHHTPDNVQATHLQCNVRRGNRDLEGAAIILDGIPS